MKPDTFCFESLLPFPPSVVFSWHLKEGALDRMIPPWQKVVVTQKGSPAEVGSQTHLSMHKGPVSTQWVARHVAFEKERYFTDEQIRGPFRFFKHTHSVEYEQEGSVWCDTIEFIPPWFISSNYVHKELQKMFHFRHRRLLEDISRIQTYALPSQKILLSGSSGMVGRALYAFLTNAGHEVYTLRRQPSCKEKKIVGWDPTQDHNHQRDFEGFDAIIHLAGENIGKKRWNAAQKDKIFKSRCRDTWLLSQIILRLQTPPKVFICASAVGIYGDRGDEVLTESSSFGNDFLASVCVEWEKSSQCLEDKGIRVCHTRFGYILDPSGGMLQQILPLFRLGLGGIMGSGQQIMPWVALDEVIYGIYHCLAKAEISGAVNLVSPSPVSQKEFALSLAKHLHKACFFPTPAWALRFALGERADALILRSARVQPDKLIASGYSFFAKDLSEYFKAFIA